MQDMSDHKSSYGFVITWMGGPIVYVSKRHTLVGLSSAEDEYMTLTHAYKWVMWLRNLLTEMGYGYLVTNPTLMLGDNAQADRWAREAMITNGNRHIEWDFHKIKEAVVSLFLSSKRPPRFMTTGAVHLTHSISSEMLRNNSVVYPTKE